MHKEIDRQTDTYIDKQTTGPADGQRAKIVIYIACIVYYLTEIMRRNELFDMYLVPFFSRLSNNQKILQNPPQTFHPTRYEIILSKNHGVSRRASVISVYLIFCLTFSLRALSLLHTHFQTLRHTHTHTCTHTRTHADTYTRTHAHM